MKQYHNCAFLNLLIKKGNFTLQKNLISIVGRGKGRREETANSAVTDNIIMRSKQAASPFLHLFH